MQLRFLRALLTLGLASCSHDGFAPAFVGSLKVQVSLSPTSRVTADTNGVDLVLDKGRSVHLNADFDSAIFAPILIGKHTLELRDVAPNCTLAQPNPDTLVVRPDSTVIAFLGGTCQ